MSYFYLIDFENVREYGISSLPATDSTDHIYVFYTENAAKLNMDAMLNHEAELKFIKVAAGKQSLDMHLVSVLGFLMRDRGYDHHYVIVSRDGGYDNVIGFWKGKGFSIWRDQANVPGSEENVSEKNEAPKKNTRSRKASSSRKNNRRKEKQEEMIPAPAAVEAPEEVPAVEEVPSAVETPDKVETVEEAPVVVTEKTAAEEAAPVQEEIPAAEEQVAEEAQPEEEVQPVVNEEPVIEEAVPAEEEKTEEPAQVKEPEAETTAEEEVPVQEETPVQEDPHTVMNKKLMNLLKGKLDANTLGAIASLVIRNMDVKNYKQVIYRAMVKKFGQKTGLEYYSMIKKEI